MLVPLCMVQAGTCYLPNRRLERKGSQESWPRLCCGAGKGGVFGATCIGALCEKSRAQSGATRCGAHHAGTRHSPVTARPLPPSPPQIYAPLGIR